MSNIPNIVYPDNTRENNFFNNKNNEISNISYPIQNTEQDTSFNLDQTENNLPINNIHKSYNYQNQKIEISEINNNDEKTKNINYPYSDNIRCSHPKGLIEQNKKEEIIIKINNNDNEEKNSPSVKEKNNEKEISLNIIKSPDIRNISQESNPPEKKCNINCKKIIIQICKIIGLIILYALMIVCVCVLLVCARGDGCEHLNCYGNLNCDKIDCDCCNCSCPKCRCKCCCRRKKKFFKNKNRVI